MGKYINGKNRLMNIKFSTQVTTEEVCANAWKLAKNDEYRKKTYIRRNMNVDKRAGNTTGKRG